jgi:hypothetical protein
MPPFASSLEARHQAFERVRLPNGSARTTTSFTMFAYSRALGALF